jgi:hypothetical protein
VSVCCDRQQIVWLVSQRHAPKREPEVDPYEAVKERSRARNLALSLADRDIGNLPNVVNPARKKRAAGDFRFFCDSYLPLTFHLPWSQDHLKVIARIECDRSSATTAARRRRGRSSRWPASPAASGA